MTTVTLRLSDDEYRVISLLAERDHRPISNFITATVLDKIEENQFVDPIEMDQIKSDSKLMQKISRGHANARKMKGKFVG